MFDDESESEAIRFDINVVMPLIIIVMGGFVC